MEGEHKVSLELTPFVALTVLTLASIFEEELPIGNKLRVSIEEYRNEAVRSMTDEDIDEAFLEKEIYETLMNNKTP